MDNLVVREDVLAWLLEPESPGARYLALRDLLDLPADDPQLGAARTAAHRQGPIAAVLAGLEESAYWTKTTSGYNPKYRSIDWSLILLAQLGASIHEDERIARACDHLMGCAFKPAGMFTTTAAPSGTVDCLQGNLCWALLELGYADPRLEQAFDWMARSNTGEGVAAQSEQKAALRYYAYKCGPDFNCGVNGSRPCAWGAVKVMLAFARLPAARRTPLIDRAIQRGVDFFFGVDPLTARWPTRTGEKPSRDWWKFGFPVFYISDLLQVAEALTGLGYARDPRLAGVIDLIRGKQDEHGRWPLEFDYAGKTWGDYGIKKQSNKWVTLRALRVLKAVEKGGV